MVSLRQQGPGAHFVSAGDSWLCAQRQHRTPSCFKVYQNITQIINYNFISREKTMLMKNERQEQQREREGREGANRFVMVFQKC